MAPRFKGLRLTRRSQSHSVPLSPTQSSTAYSFHPTPSHSCSFIVSRQITQLYAMWLNRYSGHSTPSSASPVPQRRPSHLAPNPSPQRPGLTPRASSLSLLINGSTDSLPHEARHANGSSLKYQFDASPNDAASDPLDILRTILGPSPASLSEESPDHLEAQQHHSTDPIDFQGLSLQEFADAHDDTPEQDDEPSSHSFQECTSGHSVP